MTKALGHSTRYASPIVNANKRPPCVCFPFIAMYGSYASPTMSTITSTGSSSMASSLPESERKNWILQVYKYCLLLSVLCLVVFCKNGIWVLKYTPKFLSQPDSLWFQKAKLTFILQFHPGPALPEGVMRMPADTPMEAVARQMASPDSGLDIRDRMWLKIKIPKSFIGENACLLVIWCWH